MKWCKGSVHGPSPGSVDGSGGSPMECTSSFTSQSHHPTPTTLHLLERRSEEKKVKPCLPKSSSTEASTSPQIPSPNSLAPSANIWVAQGQALLPFIPPEWGCRGGSMSPSSTQTRPSQLPAQPLHQPSPVTEPGDGFPPSNSHMALTKMLS